MFHKYQSKNWKQNKREDGSKGSGRAKGLRQNYSNPFGTVCEFEFGMEIILAMIKPFSIADYTSTASAFISLCNLRKLVQ